MTPKEDAKLSVEKSLFCGTCGFIISIYHPWCGCHLYAKVMKEKRSITWKRFWDKYWKENKT
jgi:hypothetical protein